MRNLGILLIISCLSSISACGSHANDNRALPSQEINASKESIAPAVLEDTPVIDAEKRLSTSTAIDAAGPSQTINYDLLHKKIAYGKAFLADVRQALTNTDTAAITNTIHALYAMRGHRGVYNLLFDMWQLNKKKYPELAWEQISSPPARIALASTINRVQIINTDEYKNYIRSFKHDGHEFHRAQVAIALGFNGSPDDVEYIKTLAAGTNHYVAQSAITALAIMGGDFARNAMIELFYIHGNTPRGKLLETLLSQAYDWIPPTTDDVEKAGDPVIKTDKLPD